MAFSNKELHDALVAANKTWMDAFSKGDVEGVARCYSSDGQVLPPNSDIVKGSKGIQEFWKAVMTMGIKAVDLEIVELEQHGDTAIDVGWATLKGSAGQVLDKAKYIVIWKREGGTWKVHRDMFNSNTPAKT